jgi:hypothetical protein
MLAGAAPAVAQGWYDNDYNHHRYDRDSDQYDRGHHYGWAHNRHRYADDHSYYGYRTRVCAWRYGERVCWWRTY